MKKQRDLIPNVFKCSCTLLQIERENVLLKARHLTPLPQPYPQTLKHTQPHTPSLSLALCFAVSLTLPEALVLLWQIEALSLQEVITLRKDREKERDGTLV